MFSKFIPAFAGFVFFALTISASAQSSGAAGTIDGLVTDPAGSVIPGAQVELNNQLTGYHRATRTDAAGAFHFLNIPLNSYKVTVSTTGFTVNTQDVTLRSSARVALKFALALADEHTTVTVEGGGIAMLENVSYAHSDVDRELYSKLPTSTPGSGMSDAITLASPGVVADSNGFFHPLGDHAQTSFSIDGQPISDQQSKQFSTQVPLNAIQSMELITGAPGAEFGDKTSLVVNAVTRSDVDRRAAGQAGLHAGAAQRHPIHGTHHRRAGSGVRRQDQLGGQRRDAFRAWAKALRQLRRAVRFLRHRRRGSHPRTRRPEVRQLPLRQLRA